MAISSAKSRILRDLIIKGCLLIKILLSFICRAFHRMSFQPRFIKRDQKPARDWTDLTLLPCIAERLALTELVRFRAVCNDWYSASSAASDKIEALMDQELWFLLYGGGGDNSTCTLVTEYSNKKRTIHIPELNGTTCLASSQGWLLLFREGSMFFLRHLSRAIIDIPVKFPHSVITNHVATFSAPPTSKDCVVAVFSQTETEAELYVLRRGATSWTEHKLGITYPMKIQYSAYHEGQLLFIYDTNLVARFSIEKSELCLARIVYRKSKTGLRYSSREERKRMKERVSWDGVFYLRDGCVLWQCSYQKDGAL